MKIAEDLSVGLCVNASHTFLGISLGFAVHAQSSMCLVSVGWMRSVTMHWSAHLWLTTFLTISGVQAWDGMPSRQRQIL